MRLRRFGFTFIELIIAVTMFSVLFLGLGAHLRGGIMVWRRVTATGELRQQQRVSVERMRRDFANAFIYDSREDAPTTPRFGPDAFSWTTVRVGSEYASGAMEHVRYWCGSIDGKTGLWHTRQTVGEVEAGLEALAELLIPDCESMVMEFAYAPEIEGEPMQWSSTWEIAGGLPGLVAVTFNGKRNLFSVPAGTLIPSERL